MSRSLLVFVGLVLGVAGPATGQAPDKERELAKWIRDLGSPEYREREDATEALWRMGRRVEPELQEAARSPDDEVASRASWILDAVGRGLSPDTPESIVSMVQRFPEGEEIDSWRLIVSLLEVDATSVTTALALAGGLPRTERRSWEEEKLIDKAQAQARESIRAGDLGQVERIALEATLAGFEWGARWFALLHETQGTSTDALVLLDRLADCGHGPEVLAARAYLLRLGGDLEGALAAAESAECDELAFAIRIEIGDWKAVAERLETGRGGPRDDVERRGLLAVSLYLAGERKRFEEALRALEDAIPPEPKLSLYRARLLAMCDRPGEALDEIRLRRSHAQIFRVLRDRFRFADAIAVPTDYERGEPWGGPDKFARASLLADLGELDAANEELLRARNPGRPQPEGPARIRLLKADLDRGLGRGPTTASRTAAAFARAEGHVDLAEWIEAVTRDSDLERDASYWWKFLRSERPDEDPEKTVQRLRTLVGPGAPGQDVLEYVARAEGSIDPLDRHERLCWLRSLAATCVLAGRTDLARPYLERGAREYDIPDSHILLGDLDLREGHPAEAAARYLEGWKSGEPLAMYLSGLALEQAGEAEEGKKRERIATLCLLDDVLGRELFVLDLQERGLSEHVLREGRMARGLALWNKEEACLYECLAEEEIRRERAGEAARLLECAQLGELQNTGYTRQPDLILRKRAAVHRWRAIGRAAGGDMGGALAEADACLAALPGDIELAIGLVPQLARLGHKAEADALYERVARVYREVLSAHPRSRKYRDELERLARGCGRPADAAGERK